MKRENVSVEVIVNDKSIKEYFHNNNHYIEGRKGSDFKIRVTNHNLLDDILVIPTVDGLSTVNGELGSENSPGYVIKANSSYDIEGWRVDDKSVSKFVFSDKKAGYAEATGQAGHEGSIGVMVFKKKIELSASIFNVISNHHHYHYDHYYPYGRPTIWWSTNDNYSINSGTLTNSASSNSINASLSSSSVPTKSSSQVEYSASLADKPLSIDRRISIDTDEKIATGYGEQVKSEVKEVTFDKAENPLTTFVFYYDTKKGLEKRGIVVSDKPEITEPNPFPASSKYCKAPNGGWTK